MRHPSRPSKKVRTAVGRQILPTDPPTTPEKHEIEREDLDRLSEVIPEAAKPTVLISDPSNGTEEINTPACRV